MAVFLPVTSCNPPTTTVSLTSDSQQPDGTAMVNPDILQKLINIKKTALARYSKFHVAAIIETLDGQQFSGINIESSSYGLTICAERVALFKALSEGHREFRRIYVMCDGDSPCSPCGACRQVLIDYASAAEVVMCAENGQSTQMSVTDLLPHAFSDQSLLRQS